MLVILAVVQDRGTGQVSATNMQVQVGEPCEENLPTLYRESFHPDLYIDQFFGNLESEPEIQWMLDQAHRIFGGVGEVGPLGMGEEQGVPRTLVEIGTGPIPFNTISASRWAGTIIWTDYLQRNRDYLWQLLGSSQLWERFSSFFNHVGILEGRSIEYISQRLTSRVQNILPVDATQLSPLGAEHCQADVVFSHLCLEYVVSERKLFRKIIKNIIRIIKPGGFLVLQSAMGADSYYMGDVKFPSTNTSKAFLELCLTEAGLKLIEYKEFSSPTAGEEYGLTPGGEKTTDHAGVYSLVAQKGVKL